ncbi:DUF2849 domain-containing protein [Amorphus sp. 3PC139-8]|uniref:DUF2849 domain-containing protein n=1 Tax=Amorphus sp. 3PC139-8 TaxID=2735676 RepID=UPI00345CED5F
MKVVTANRLIDGIVVFLGRSQRWVEQIDDVSPFEDDAAIEAALAYAARCVEAREIVEPYAIDVRADKHGVTPVRLREAIRAKGPTVRLDLGKQAERATVDTAA